MKRHRDGTAVSAQTGDVILPGHSSGNAVTEDRERQFSELWADDAIDVCINNAIIGVQEQNTYAQTEGER